MSTFRLGHLLKDSKDSCS